MGRIFNLFAKRLEMQSDAEEEDAAIPGKVNLSSGFSGTEAAIFETIGETQQSIDGALASIIGNLRNMQKLADNLGEVRAEVTGALEDHRKIALAGLSLEHDRDRLEQQLTEKVREADKLVTELMQARAFLEDSRANHNKAKSELEMLEQRHHLLGVAKREVDDQVARQSAILLASQDEAEAMRLEVVSLRERTAADDARLTDLIQSNQEQLSQITLLTSRCENYENIVRLRGEELITLNEQVNKLNHSNDARLQELQQRDRELTALRGEMSRLFERNQADLRAKDTDLNALRSEHDLSHSSLKVLDQLNADLKTDLEKQVAEIRRLQDHNKQLEMAAARAEAKSNRLAASLDATQVAKNQTDQSRSAMAARVESMSQALRSAEADNRRLENDVGRLSALLDQQGAQARDTIEALNARVSTLEKELATQAKETVFYMAQLDQIKRTQ